MNPYLSKNQGDKLDPITGKSIAETKAQMSKLNGVTKKPVAKVVAKPAVKKNSGLGIGDKFMKQAMANHKYNQDNKYRVSGINISNRTGDTIGRIFNALTK